MQHRVEYSTDRSCTVRINFICKHGNVYPFVLCVGQASSIWRFFKVNPVHTCEVNFNRVALRCVLAKILGKYFSRKLTTDNAGLRPNDTIVELLSEFVIQIDYIFALCMRKITMEMVFGEFDKSFEALLSYLHMLQSCNPGTLYDISTFFKIVNSNTYFLH